VIIVHIDKLYLLTYLFIFNPAGGLWMLKSNECVLSWTLMQ